MCIAVPAKIIELDESAAAAKAEYMGNIVNVNIRLVPAKMGDYVLVHAGCAIEIVSHTFAEETMALFEEIARDG